MRAKRLLSVFLLLTSVAVGGLLIAQLIGAQDEGPARPGVSLILQGRSSLSVCVDESGGTAARERVEFVADALRSALASIGEDRQPLADPHVVGDCRPGVLLTAGPVPTDERHSPAGPARILRSEDEISQHQLHVYVLTSQDFGTRFPDEDHASATEETLCHLDACRPVTLGLYVPDSISEDQLRDPLLRTLALLPATPRPTIDWAECEEPEPSPDAWWCFEIPEDQRPTPDPPE